MDRRKNGAAIGQDIPGKARVTGAHVAITNRTYIRATGYPNNTFDRYLAEAEADPSWRAEVLDTSHDAMITASDDIVRILLEVASSTERGA